MTSSEKMSEGISLLAEGLTEVMSDIANSITNVFKEIQPLFNFWDKRITRKKFKKLLQSYGIQRNEINKIIAVNEEPYTLRLIMKYIKESE